MKRNLIAISLLPLLLVAGACADDGDGDTTTAEAGTDDSADDDSADDDSADDDSADDDSADDEGGIPDPHAIPDGGDPGAIMCAELGSLCHAFDDGDGELGDVCHDTGHLGDPEACAEIYDECIAFCQSDAGDHADDDHADDDHADDDHADAGHSDDGETGVSLCEELGSICHDADTGEGLGHECHEVGHAGDHEACLAIYDECAAFCLGDGGSTPHEDDEPLDAGHDEAEGGRITLCADLGSRCHDYDTGEGLGHECHEVGHAGDHEACVAIYDECFEFCQGDAGITPHDSPDAGSDAGN